MAEVPLPTPTQVPVPSTDIRNTVFAGAKLDEEVTGSGEYYTDRLGVKRLTNTGRNNKFNAAQQERESRFDAFIQSSGYEVIGDYTAGPLTITEYNQLIRYNNELYKLTAATNIPFTASGKTDETWTTTDSAHFVSVGDAALRQNLGSNEPGMGASISKLQQPGNVQNALREFYADAFPGIDPTGKTSSTQGILDAIAQINSQVDSTFNGDITTYPRLVFRGGVFLAAGLLVKSNIVIEGNDGTLFVPEAGTDASHVWITKGTGATTPSGGAKRLFRPVFRNIKIGYGFQNKFDDVVIAENVGGIKLEHSSYAIMENVEMRYLDGEGLTGESVWDSTIYNVRIMHCGNTRDRNNIKYGLNFGPGNDGTDGSNANRFIGLHIETCPAMMKFGKRSRHNFIIGGKLEGIRNNDPLAYGPSVFEGVDGLQFLGVELSWSNIGHRMFKAVGTTVMNDTSDDDTSDYENDHCRGIEFIGCHTIDSQNLSGDYFEYSSKRGRLNITGGYMHHVRYLLTGSDINLRCVALTQCGPTLGNIGDNVLVEGLMVENHRVLPSGTFNVFSVSGKNNVIRNCEFSTPYGSNSNGCAWIAQSSVADLRVENVTFGGKMQWGIKGAPSAFQYKKFKNLVLADGADYGEIVQGGFSVDGLPTRLINNSGGAVTLMQEVAANTTAIFRGCIHGSASLTIRVENSAGAYVGAATALTDFSISTPQITGNLSNNFSAGGSGTPGDGRFYISSSGNDLSFTNRTNGTVKVYLISINAKM
ncbi:hypothetical protein C2U50_29280 [Klebsiella pneumoniae]|uniref:hypothetical protein n=1 Tax=Klebsiella pneumoniae TaxID=573 RepID=UPI000CD28A93|nr:hypothetical protein [Klebsiella pneumoniae]AUV40500.1 hypothetical protein C2U50_29280 [Klebsiella pneumoniae]